MANALNKVNSGGIEDGSIVNADIKSDAAIAGTKLADNAVGLAQMASGTDGQIITYDASGDPIAVGPGTDGQVLTSTGAGSPPAFETLPTSGATLSGSTDNTVVTVTGANAMQGEANLTFNGSKLVATGDIECSTGYYQTNSSTERFSLTHDGANCYLENQIGSFYVKSVDNANTLEVGNGAVTLNSANLVIGTSGKGIDFSADTHAGGMENELLDDYEEGTWTPALTYNGTAVSLNTPVGTYVKIGNFVCCRCRLMTTNNPDNGNVSITGLPFASSNPSNDGNAITGAMYMESADSNVTSGHPIAFGFDNSSQFDCRYSGQTGGGTNVADNCKTGTAFMTTISYQTA